jgi:hypothetical protein
VAVGGARIEFPLSAAVGGPCAYARLVVGVAGARTGRILFFPLFSQDFHKYASSVIHSKKIDSHLGDVVIGDELTHFSASEFGIKVLG